MGDVICLGDIEQIADHGSKGFRVGDQSLFAVRHQSEVYVYRNACPHLGIELEWFPDQFLDSHRQFIQCATHGALFLIQSGECVSGPCSGEHLTPVVAKVIDGKLWIEMESPKPSRS